VRQLAFEGRILGAWKLGMIWVFEEVLLDVLPPARPRGYHGHKRQRRRKPSI
jgi:hypothetical protein